MTTTGIVIIIAVAFIGAVLFLELGAVPGKVARERGHLQADAINVLGWIGLVTGGPGWVVALVWAYTRPGPLTGSEPALEAPPAGKSAEQGSSPP